MKRGRPPLDEHETSVPIHLTVTAATYDRLYAQARAERVTVPEIVRQAVRRTLTAPAEKDSSE